MALGVPVKITVADCPEQTVVMVELIEAVGSGTTVMVTDPVTGCEQLGVPEVATLTKVQTVVTVYVLVRVAVPEALRTMVWFGPPFTVYVTVAFGVPAKVIVADPPGQTLALLEMLTVGNCKTVMVIEPVTGWLQPGVPDEDTLTRL